MRCCFYFLWNSHFLYIFAGIFPGMSKLIDFPLNFFISCFFCNNIFMIYVELTKNTNTHTNNNWKKNQYQSVLSLPVQKLCKFWSLLSSFLSLHIFCMSYIKNLNTSRIRTHTQNHLHLLSLSFTSLCVCSYNMTSKRDDAIQCHLDACCCCIFHVIHMYTST